MAQFPAPSRPATPGAASTATTRRARSAHAQERPPRQRLPADYCVRMEVQRLRYRSKVVDTAGALGLVSRHQNASVTQRRAEQVVALARAGLCHDPGESEV